MNKKDLSERDICSKFIGPAIKRAGWDGMLQVREEVAFTKGRIIVRGKLVTRGKAKRADLGSYGSLSSGVLRRSKSVATIGRSKYGNEKRVT